MSYLVDTNVLLRSIQVNHPMHNVALQSLQKLIEQGEILCLVPQNLIEFWAVATRPLESNGLALSISETIQELAQLKQFFSLKADIPEIYAE